VDSNKKEKMEEIPLEEKKEPDTDTKSQVWAIHCNPDSDPPEGEEGAGHWCQEPGMSHYHVLLTQIPLEEQKDLSTDAKS
jgi:hypothetical protein